MNNFLTHRYYLVPPLKEVIAKLDKLHSTAPKEQPK